MDRCHLIPKQRIRKQLRSDRPNLDPETLLRCVWHESMWVPGCRQHHSELDVSRVLRIPREDIPEITWAVAALFRVEWSLEYDYPPS